MSSSESPPTPLPLPPVVPVVILEKISSTADFIFIKTSSCPSCSCNICACLTDNFKTDRFTPSNNGFWATTFSWTFVSSIFSLPISEIKPTWLRRPSKVLRWWRNRFSSLMISFDLLSRFDIRVTVSARSPRSPLASCSS